MRRFPAITFSLLLLSFMAVLFLAACGGGGGSDSSSSPEVTQITLSVSPAVLDRGKLATVTAIPKNAAGNQVTQATATFSVDSGQNLISVSRGGTVCAGQWDSLTTPVVCTPTTGSGTAHVIASVGTVQNQVAVIVLPPIDNVSVVPVTSEASPDPAFPVDNAGLPCISQSSTADKYTANTRKYTVVASFNGSPVTLTDDMKDTLVTWGTEQKAVGTAAPQTTTDSTTSTTTTDTRIGIVTAITPGKTRVFATLGNHTSLPTDFIVCPVKQIIIADNASTTLPLSSTTKITVTPTVTDSHDLPTVLDSRDHPVFLTTTTTDTTTNTTTTNSLFNLSWSNSQTNPTTLTATLTGSTAGTASVTATTSPGTSTIVASCTPPGCNLGLGSVYSNPFVVPVTGTAPGTTVYVGSAAQASGSTTTAPGKTLLPITTADNKIGTAVTLGDVPNSVMLSPNGLTMFIGTASGLILMTPGSATAGNPITTAPGKVLAVSPDNTTAIVFNDATSQVFVVTAASGKVQSFNLGGVVAAAFSTDSSKAYVVSKNNQVAELSVYTPSSSVVPEPILDGSGVGVTSATDASFLASGPFAYVADSAGLNVYATCNDLNTLLTFGSSNPPSRQVVGLTPAPALVRALPDGFNLLTAASPTSGSPQMNLVTSEMDEKGFLTPSTGCAPAVSSTVKSTVTLSSATGLVGKQLLVTSDGKNAFLLSDAGTLLGAKIDTTAGTLTPVSIPLQSFVNGTAQTASVQQTTGGITTSGGLIFFGGSDGQIHRIDLTATTPTDTPIVLTGAPTGFTPDFVVVQPK